MADTRKNGFLGRGWSFPPSFDVDTQSVQMTENEVDIERSLHILLTTAVGERVMLPRYGCDMADYLFASMNTTTKSLVKDRIKTAILYYEPRIDVKLIELDDSGQNEGRLVVHIEYVMRATNSRFNFVFPYYVQEASEIGFLTGKPL